MKEMSEKVVNNLQKENDSLKKKVERVDLNILRAKIEDLKNQNDEKETQIQSLHNEEKYLVSSKEKCESEGSDEIQKLLKEIDAIRNNNAENVNAIETLEKEKE